MNSVEMARRKELERALRLLRRGRDAGEVLEAMSRRLTNKLLHAPTRALRETSHGRKGLSRLVHGSQTIDVLTHSDIPTLVVR